MHLHNEEKNTEFWAARPREVMLDPEKSDAIPFGTRFTVMLCVYLLCWLGLALRPFTLVVKKERGRAKGAWI